MQSLLKQCKAPLCCSKRRSIQCKQYVSSSRRICISSHTAPARATVNLSPSNLQRFGTVGYSTQANPVSQTRENRSTTTVLLRDIPTIDVSAGGAGPAIEAIQQACTNWGFFKVVGHGVPQADIAATNAAILDFFRQPKELKRKVKRSESNARGWFDDELTKQTLDLKEGFDFGHKPHPDLPDDDPRNQCMDGYNQWPQDLPEFRQQMELFYRLMGELAARLTGYISLAMGCPENHFVPSFTKHTSFLRLNFYPTSTKPNMLGINPHTDAGFLTVLMMDDVPALQVLKDGQWVTVAPDPEAFIINIGDMCQVWSNGQYKAALHRVTSHPERTRISYPFFYNPNYDVDVAPLPSLGPAKYKPINWGAYRRRRFEGDYADKGTEVQITDYLI